jgi:hypothetical protein
LIEIRACPWTGSEIPRIKNQKPEEVGEMNAPIKVIIDCDPGSMIA